MLSHIATTTANHTITIQSMDVDLLSLEQEIVRNFYRIITNSAQLLRML